MSDDAQQPTVPSHASSRKAPTGRGPTVGQPWGKFLIEKRLGGGGQAEVFQAFDQLGTAGHVALKIPLSSLPPHHLQQWADAEAGTLVRLDHPGIVDVVDAGRVGSSPYVATKLVEGLPLNEYVRANPPSEKQVLGWMIRLADALEFAHRRGITHRDLKPMNVIVTPHDEPLLIDFGMASLVTPYQAEPRRDRSGTYPFMAPEQARGEASADSRADVFGLGGILKFLLVGAGPYHGASDPIAAARNGRVQPITDIAGSPLHRALCRVANRALEPQPEDRYRSMAELSHAFRRLRSRPRAVAMGAAVLLAILGVVAAAVMAARRDPDAAAGPVEVAGLAVPQQLAGTSLVVHFQRQNRLGIHKVLSPDDVPLQIGDGIRLHVYLPEPMAAYLLSIKSDGKTVLLHPPRGTADVRVSEIHVPAGPEEWLPLEAPGGTRTIVLLARQDPVANPEAMVNRVAALGQPPSLTGQGILTIDEYGARLLPGRRSGRGTRQLRVEKGMLEPLLRYGSPQWEVVRAVAFTYGPEVPVEGGTNLRRPTRGSGIVRDALRDRLGGGTPQRPPRGPATPAREE
jgi:hypothetical protein